MQLWEHMKQSRLCQGFCAPSQDSEHGRSGQPMQKQPALLSGLRCDSAPRQAGGARLLRGQPRRPEQPFSKHPVADRRAL